MKHLLCLILLTFGLLKYCFSQNSLQKATFGMGCFWCTEAVFKKLNGVVSVVSGYEGGHLPNPTYQEVTTGETGHAEVVEITFDVNKIKYEDLLEVFWKIHDPTTLNRQGADIGTQYRSVIFYHDNNQKESAERYKKLLNSTNVFGKKVVTEISPTKKFYSAEAYHQNYYENNKDQAYCKVVILPKLEELEKLFKNKLKKSP